MRGVATNKLGIARNKKCERHSHGMYAGKSKSWSLGEADWSGARPDYCTALHSTVQ